MLTVPLCILLKLNSTFYGLQILNQVRNVVCDILWKYSCNRFFSISLFFVNYVEFGLIFLILEMHVKLNSTFYGFQILNQVRNVVCETLFLKIEIKWQVSNYAVLLIGTCKMFLKICLNI